MTYLDICFWFTTDGDVIHYMVCCAHSCKVNKGASKVGSIFVIFFVSSSTSILSTFKFTPLLLFLFCSTALLNMAIVVAIFLPLSAALFHHNDFPAKLRGCLKSISINVLTNAIIDILIICHDSPQYVFLDSADHRQIKSLATINFGFMESDR